MYWGFGEKKKRGRLGTDVNAGLIFLTKKEKKRCPMDKYQHLKSVIGNFTLSIKFSSIKDNFFGGGADNEPVMVLSIIYFYLLHLLYMCYHHG